MSATAVVVCGNSQLGLGQARGFEHAMAGKLNRLTARQVQTITKVGTARRRRWARRIRRVVKGVSPSYTLVAWMTAIQGNARVERTLADRRSVGDIAAATSPFPIPTARSDKSDDVASRDDGSILRQRIDCN